MVLESTMICVDNSDFMRNGDFVPTRLQAQQDAVNVLCHAKLRANPENNVGVLTLAGIEVLVTLTSDSGRILSKLHQVQPGGNISFGTAIKIAHLALKHRQGKNHRMRIVVFVGSPIEEDEKEMQKLSKKLKKENVNVDIVNFGEENSQSNLEKLTAFVNTLNSKGCSSSNLVTVASGGLLSEALVHSPIIAGEDGTGVPPGSMAGFEFGVDPNEDPELALALRVSMEEQRARQERDTKESSKQTVKEAVIPEETDEETILKKAMDMSLDQPETDTKPQRRELKGVDFGSMTEDEQIAYAMQLSMQASAMEEDGAPMETDAKDAEDDMDAMANDPDFLQSVLEDLPGVDMQSDAIRDAMNQLTRRNTEQGKKDDKSKK